MRCHRRSCPHAEPCRAFIEQSYRAARRAGGFVGVVATVYGWSIASEAPASGYVVYAAGSIVAHRRIWTDDGPTSESWVVVA